MENVSLIGLSRQVALRHELDVVANNVANINTTGFKADSLVFNEYLMPNAKVKEDALPGAPISYVVDRGMLTNFAPGTLQTTGNDLDVAIKGDGFFAVQTAQGERYTRAGSLGLNANGDLVTADGNKVMGDGGPLTFTTQDTKITIAADGTVSTIQNGEQIKRGKLKLVTLKTGELKKEGDALFSSSAPAQPDTQSRVIQGALETSNVRPVQEISRMIEISRAYEQIGDMVKRTQDLQQATIERLSQAA